MTPTTVFVTGGTGYVGRPLVEMLVARKHTVLALARAGSEQKVSAGANAVVGDALDAASFAHAIPRDATIVHLVGTPHPNPAKAAEFERVDLASIQATANAAFAAGAAHIVYVSVARPAPVMRSYIAARERGEAAVVATGLPATFLRPWYVLGPGHYWPVRADAAVRARPALPADARAGHAPRPRHARPDGGGARRSGRDAADRRYPDRRRSGHRAGTIARMKSILCFGDSLTWGYNPRDGSRYPFVERWPGVLQGRAGPDVRVIEEGLSGRTAITDSWVLPHR